jgi:uncharacterized membrane-anchored protein
METRHATFPHRARLELHQELHARSALAARSPCVVSSWINWEMDPARAEAALSTLCLSAGAAAPAAGVRHHVLHAPTYSLKYERHGEFVSWQVSRPTDELAEDADDAQWRSALLESSGLIDLPDAFIARLGGEGGGQVIAATHVVMVRAKGADEFLPRALRMVAAQAGPIGGDDSAPVMGAFVGDEHRGAVLTHLKLGIDGFTRFILLDFKLPADQAAREAQRLCEIEAYRMLAMLGFPVAQREGSQLRTLEDALLEAVDHLAKAAEPDEAQTFETLTRLAAEVEHGTARTRYRFSATRAYQRIVEQRLADLREQRIVGVQTLSGFMRRRFAPAMALCDTTDARLHDIAERINRAVSLAQVRVETRREQGNQELLRALAHRQQLQLRLQQTVEGLSVFAISYYALGLVGYLAKAAKSLSWLDGINLQPDAVVGIALVPVVATVAWFARKLHAGLEGH